MKIETTHIAGPIIFTPKMFADERGTFCETFKRSALIEVGIESDFVQDNQAQSGKNVLRGLHFQKQPHAQGKLVRVVRGAVRDIIVDLRKSSATFGQYLSLELSAENNKILWVPIGFAHGYLSLSDDSIFLYKVTSYYDKASENGIRWDDASLAIDWGLQGCSPIVSSKDQELPSLSDLGNVFE